jgi:hypothetical protein
MSGLRDAVEQHYREPQDRQEKRLRQRAYGFRVDPGMEQALRTRAKDPARYDAEMERHGSGLPLALYADAREAAIALGLYDPDKEAE